MNKKHLLAIGLFMLISYNATAQFKKPLTSPRDRIQSSEARFNVGICGGGNFSTWLHINSPQAADWYLADYTPTPLNSIGYFGGIALEYMLSANQSVGLNALFSHHNISLGYINEHFPTGLNQHVRREYELNARHFAIEAYVPLTFYFPLSPKRTVMPYVFVAPRVSYILNAGSLAGRMGYTTTNLDINTMDTISSTTMVSAINDSTFRMLNVGATVGIGSEFRINTSNYYLIFKVDVSANMYGLSTFTKTDLQNEFNHLRYSADAQATVTFMLPIKKRLQGACMRWGEYD